MRLAKWIGLVACMAALPAVALTEAEVKKIGKSVVRIHATMQTMDYRVPWNGGRVGRSTGTGFFIGNGQLMTNAHVVSNARFLGVKKEGDPTLYTATVKHVAHDCDLAIMEVEDKSFFTGMEALSFGDLPALHSFVDVFGYPIGGERMSVTRGVVSRIEFRPYAHSSLDSHLAIQIDAAINPGNSGGPVLQGQRVVGVAFQGISGAVAQNTGYMIPTPVIKRFLEDIKDDRYDGYAEIGISHFNLTNPSYRAKLGLPAGRNGIVVTGVLTNGSSDGILEKGDVLLSIDGHIIASDGKINLNGEVVEMEEIVERKFRGDQVTIEILRAGKKQTVSVTLKGAEPYRMYITRYDEKPRYKVFAGLVFQPINRNFMGTHGVKDPEIVDLFTFYVEEELFTEYPEIVVLSSILADPINTHLTVFNMSVIDTVNGKEVRTLQALDTALSKPAERYVLRFLGKGVPLVIEAKDIKAAEARISKQYQVTKMKYLGEDKEADQ